MATEASVGVDGAQVAVLHNPAAESFKGYTFWTCEKWSEEACDYARRKEGVEFDAVSSLLLRKHVGPAELLEEIPGNLLVNEGIQRLLDLLIAAGGTAYNNANAYIGVGDTSTAATATDTELNAANSASNRFYKAMNATYPSRSSQTVSWQADFASSEANFAWNEWTVSAGATTASGSGFLVGTTNLNHKIASLGTKTSGTWTLTSQITIS